MCETTDKYKHYVQDLGQLMKEYALEVKQAREKKVKETEKALYDGMLLAYHRIISLMQQQAESFEIALEDINLQDVTPDRDLV